MKNDRAYAFVEFRDPEDADICIALDGAAIGGVILRLRRTNNYTPPPGYDEQCKRKWKLPGVVPTHVEDGPNKLYFFGLPRHWNEETVLQMARQAGDVSAFTLVRDKHTGESKGYAFMAYTDPANTDSAIQILNNLQVEGAQLQCKRARIPGQPMGAPMMGGGAPMMHGQPPIPGHHGGYDTSAILGVGSAPPPTQPPPPPMPASRILVLGNMVTENDLNNDEDYAGLTEDINTECSKHGAIDKLVIPRPGQGLDSLIGKIFLAYRDNASAAAASQALASRFFDGKQVRLAQPVLAFIKCQGADLCARLQCAFQICRWCAVSSLRMNGRSCSNNCNSINRIKQQRSGQSARCALSTFQLS